MTKKFIMAMIAFSAVTFGALAANDTKANDISVKKEQCCQKDGCKGRQARNPFEGLNLTADQKAKLEALRESRKCGKAQECKQGQQAGRRDRKQCKQEYLGKVKEILTPEQYTQFLENQVMRNGGKRHGCHNNNRNGERNCKAVCPNNSK